MNNMVRYFMVFAMMVSAILSGSSMNKHGGVMEAVITPVAVAAERFVDNGDGTITDTVRQLMWQQGDNGGQATFAEAQKYCKNLRLGGYNDWRLPNPDERDTATAMELMMPRHARDIHSHFDLYWSSDRTVLIPFNYHPSYGREVQRAYPARGDDKAFVRAVRSVRTS